MPWKYKALQRLMMRKYNAAWRERNREGERQRNREYRLAHPKPKMVRLVAYSMTPTAVRSRAYRERWPGRHEARIAVRNALRQGKLERHPCEVCGGRAEAHHDDYAKPLDVYWLCKAHHEQIHH